MAKVSAPCVQLLVFQMLAPQVCLHCVLSNDVSELLIQGYLGAEHNAMCLSEAVCGNAVR